MQKGNASGDALVVLEALTESPSLRVLFPARRFPALLAEAARAGRTTGNLAFDAQVAAVLREHGVGHLLTRDRDFSRFPWIRIIDLDEEPRELP